MYTCVYDIRHKLSNEVWNHEKHASRNPHSTKYTIKEMKYVIPDLQKEAGSASA